MKRAGGMPLDFTSEIHQPDVPVAIAFGDGLDSAGAMAIEGSSAVFGPAQIVEDSDSIRIRRVEMWHALERDQILARA